MLKSNCFYTKRLLVRSFDSRDFDSFFRLLNHPMINHFLGAHRFFSRLDLIKDFLIQMSSKKDPAQSQSWLLYSIVDRTNQQLIGGCGLKIDLKYIYAEIFYLMFPEYWGQGLAAEACFPILENSFRMFGLKSIIAFIDPKNKRAQRVAAKLGFSYIEMNQLKRYYQRIEVQQWAVLPV